MVVVLAGELSISLICNEGQKEGFGVSLSPEVWRDLGVNCSGYGQGHVLGVDVAVCHFEPLFVSNATNSQGRTVVRAAAFHFHRFKSGSRHSITW